MNRFFFPHGDVPFEPPKQAYARFDQSEPQEIEEAEEVVFAFDAVDAQWFDQWFSLLRSPGPLRHYINFLRSHFYGEDSNRGREPPPKISKLWHEMPLYRFEVVCSRDEKLFKLLYQSSQRESNWLLISQEWDRGIPADVWGNLFGEPVETRVAFSDVGKAIASDLSASFDMNSFPDANKSELKNALDRDIRVDFLAAYDIGQGSANGLLDDSRRPQLYFDLGCGAYRNARTAPSTLDFCWRHDPTVVLSHWDTDHWAGARKDTNALARTWIAPRQSLGPTHSAFARDILMSGGQVLLWGYHQAPITVPCGQGRQMTVFRCNGPHRDRNASGLGLIIENKDRDRHTSWLLTGDAGYDRIPLAIPGDPVGVVVPHHGAKMSKKFLPGRPNANTYARLIYSFGPDNKHGKTNIQHPVWDTVADHSRLRWDHGSWTNPPGTNRAGCDVLATAEHPATHLGGAIIGWSGAPNIGVRPNCSGCPISTSCSISLDQS